MREAFVHLFRRSNKLSLTTGEMFPASRLLAEDVAATEMVGVEHLGQYVFEMTKAKVESLKGEGTQVPVIEETLEVRGEDEEDEDEGEDEGEGMVEEVMEGEEGGSDGGV